MKNKKVFWSLFLVVQIITLKILSFFPEFTERYYSNGIYPPISKALRILLGWIPFSFGDLAYSMAVLLILRWGWKTRKTWKKEYKSNLLTITTCISVGYFLFYFLWAVNYHRVPLYQKLGIAKELNKKELLAFTEKLILKSNTLQNQITHNDSTRVISPYTQQEIYKRTLNGYTAIALQHPYFQYDHLSIKNSLLSIPLTYMGFAGYLNPFTNEAQVNDMIPLYNYPTTACHEMAHQIGYASESEANFIGFLASVHNDDVYFQYSGYTFALKYCLRLIEREDEALYENLMAKINYGIILNICETEEFWDRYENPSEVVFKIFYDNYLKMNQQKDGLGGYAKFVGLMVNYYNSPQGWNDPF